jgi:hypothetical protein
MKRGSASYLTWEGLDCLDFRRRRRWGVLPIELSYIGRAGLPEPRKNGKEGEYLLIQLRGVDCLRIIKRGVPSILTRKG